MSTPDAQSDDKPDDKSADKPDAKSADKSDAKSADKSDAQANPGIANAPHAAEYTSANTPADPRTEDGVRTFHPKDFNRVTELYTTGLLAGQIAANDTGADIDNLHEAYFADERHHFWVAESNGGVQGMIGVSSDDHNTAEIRRLRVDPGHQKSPIAAALLQTAVAFCREKEYLKIRLDTRFEKSEAVDLFDRVGFQHTRTRKGEDKDLLEFYVDLYRPVKDDSQNPSS